MTVVVAVLFVVVGVVAYVALRNAQDFSDANEVVPGVKSNAPKSWAGSHTPEARLHRRLRDAVLALQSNSSLDDPSLTDVRATLEREALGVDDRLVAVAALPKGRRSDLVREVEKAVHAIEEAVTSVVALRGPSLESVERGIEDVKARMLLVESAREELEMLAPGPRSLDRLRDHLDADDPAANGSDEPRSGHDHGTDG